MINDVDVTFYVLYTMPEYSNEVYIISRNKCTSTNIRLGNKYVKKQC